MNQPTTEHVIANTAPSPLSQLWFQLGWRVVISIAILWLIVQFR